MKHMKLHESFFEGIARVCLTTESTESTEFLGAGWPQVIATTQWSQ